MKLIDAAKRGKYADVIAALDRGEPADLDQLLQKACQDFHTVKKGDGHLRLARELIARGAEPQRELACEAARGGHLGLIQLLCEQGLGPDLFTAAAMGDDSFARERISARPDEVSARDANGITPLHYCCASAVWRQRAGSENALSELCRRLLAAGADIHAAGEYFGLGGITPLFYCAWTGGLVAIARQLLDRGAQVTPTIFFAAVGHFQRHGDGNYAVAAEFLKRGFDINHNDGRTALHAFAGHGDARGVAWLLQHGADVGARDADGNTPLIAAARRNTGTKVVAALVAAGAAPRATNGSGLNAMEAARQANRAKIVQFLAGLKA